VLPKVRRPLVRVVLVPGVQGRLKEAVRDAPVVHVREDAHDRGGAEGRGVDDAAELLVHRCRFGVVGPAVAPPPGQRAQVDQQALHQLAIGPARRAHPGVGGCAAAAAAAAAATAAVPVAGRRAVLPPQEVLQQPAVDRCEDGKSSG